MSLFQPIGVPTTNNFLVQTLKGPSLRTMPAGLTSAWECARLRTTMIEAAWPWLRYQPGSALSRWFQEPLKRSNHFDSAHGQADAVRPGDFPER